MKRIKKDEDILIIQLPIDTGNEIAFSMALDDRLLIDNICRYADDLRKQDVEVFKREKNVIATERGFYFAIYEDVVSAVESGDFKPE
jgi:hypothetical protein